MDRVRGKSAFVVGMVLSAVFFVVGCDGGDPIPGPVDTVPVVQAGADQAITLPDDSVALTASVDGDNLTAMAWTKISGPGSVTFSDSDALRTDATFSQAGTYTLEFSATNSAGTGSDRVSVVVHPAANVPTDKAPVVGAGSDQVLQLPKKVATLTATIVGENITAMMWTKISGPGSVTFSNAGASATDATFSQTGTYTLEFTATNAVGSSSDRVIVVVNPANAPIVNAGRDQTVQLPANVVALKATATGDGIDAMAWTCVNGPSAVTFLSANQLSTQATFTEAGVYTIQFSATNSGGTASDVLTVTVKDGGNASKNVAPTVNAGIDRTITWPTKSLTIDATANDDALPTPHVLTAKWIVVKATGGKATFADASIVNAAVSFSAPGTYTLRLIVSDSEYASSDTMTVTVNPQPNVAATLSQASADGELVLGVACDVTLSVTATDADGTVASIVADLSAVGGSANQALTAAGSTWSWSGTLTPTALGECEVTFTATDNDNAQASVSYTVTVIRAAWAKVYSTSDAGPANKGISQRVDDIAMLNSGHVLLLARTPETEDIALVEVDENGAIVDQDVYAGTAADPAEALDVAADGSRFVAGRETSERMTAQNFFVAKIADNDDIVWQKMLGSTHAAEEDGSDTILYHQARDIRATSDGGCIAAGHVQTEALTWNLLITKLTSNGNVTWQKSIGIADRHDDVWTLATTADGGCIVAAAMNSNLAGPATFTIVWIDSTGERQNVKTYCVGATPTAMTTLADGSLIVVGSTTAAGAGGSDIFVVKLTAAGAIVWQKAFGGSANDTASAVAVNDAGQILVAGATASFGKGANDAFVLLLEDDGTLIRAAAFGSTGNDEAKGIVTPDATSAVMVGRFSSIVSNEFVDRALAVRFNGVLELIGSSAGTLRTEVDPTETALTWSAADLTFPTEADWSAYMFDAGLDVGNTVFVHDAGAFTATTLP